MSNTNESGLRPITQHPMKDYPKEALIAMIKTYESKYPTKHPARGEDVDLNQLERSKLVEIAEWYRNLDFQTKESLRYQDQITLKLSDNDDPKKKQYDVESTDDSSFLSLFKFRDKSAIRTTAREKAKKYLKYYEKEQSIEFGSNLPVYTGKTVKAFRETNDKGVSPRKVTDLSEIRARNLASNASAYITTAGSTSSTDQITNSPVNLSTAPSTKGSGTSPYQKPTISITNNKDLQLSPEPSDSNNTSESRQRAASTRGQLSPEMKILYKDTLGEYKWLMPQENKTLISKEEMSDYNLLMNKKRNSEINARKLLDSISKISEYTEYACDMNFRFTQALESIHHELCRMQSDKRSPSMDLAMDKYAKLIDDVKNLNKDLTNKIMEVFAKPSNAFVQRENADLDDKEKNYNEKNQQYHDFLVKNCRKLNQKGVSEEVEKLRDSSSVATEAYFSKLNEIEVMGRLKFLSAFYGIYEAQQKFFQDGTEKLLQDKQTLSGYGEVLRKNKSEAPEQLKRSLVRKDMSNSPAKMKGFLFSARKVKRGRPVGEHWDRFFFQIGWGKFIQYVPALSPEGKMIKLKHNMFDIRMTSLKIRNDLDRPFVMELVSVDPKNTTSLLLQCESQQKLNEWQAAYNIAITEKLSDNVTSSDTTRVKIPQFVLDSLLAKNKRCVDCNKRILVSKDAWASINFGVMMCIECGGVHRMLGVDVSMVRSISLDLFDVGAIKILMEMSNDFVNQILEEKLTSNTEHKKIQPDCPRSERESFIFAKYQKKLFVQKPEDKDLDSLLFLLITRPIGKFAYDASFKDDTTATMGEEASFSQSTAISTTTLSTPNPTTKAMSESLRDLLTLLIYGANPKAVDKDGNNPLYLAAQNHLPLHVQLLLSNNAFVNQPGPNQETALFPAARNLDVETISVLANWGIDKNSKNKAGETAQDVIKKLAPHQNFSRAFDGYGLNLDERDPLDMIRAEFEKSEIPNDNSEGNTSHGASSEGLLSSKINNSNKVITGSKGPAVKVSMEEEDPPLTPDDNNTSNANNLNSNSLSKSKSSKQKPSRQHSHDSKSKRRDDGKIKKQQSEENVKTPTKRIASAKISHILELRREKDSPSSSSSTISTSATNSSSTISTVTTPSSTTTTTSGTTTTSSPPTSIEVGFGINVGVGVDSSSSGGSRPKSHRDSSSSTTNTSSSSEFKVSKFKGKNPKRNTLAVTMNVFDRSNKDKDKS
eukprot:TRINITY_DN3646_c0_g1_i3.p1 TRINITY_DN3646_c0_g1~~TRINITY_DN3646_c0_g1_i3.p1  ORF type:complete len:1216 (+),score=354.17 TRINITY_DN3646_c0_g1_i3:42-3689(+)